jgi:hypothetical protein
VVTKVRQQKLMIWQAITHAYKNLDNNGTITIVVIILPTKNIHQQKKLKETKLPLTSL